MADEVPLREHVEQMFEVYRQAHDSQHEDHRRAHDAQHRATQRELENTRLTADEAIKHAREAVDAQLSGLSGQVAALEAWKSKATGVGLALVAVSGIAGGLIVKALGG